MYDLSKCISKSVWEKLELEYKYNKEEEGISFGEDDITKSNIIWPIVKKYNNLHVIRVKDMANKKKRFMGLILLLKVDHRKNIHLHFRLKFYEKMNTQKLVIYLARRRGSTR